MIKVPVDFLTSEHRYIPKNEFFDITGINAITSPGCELSFDVNEKVRLSGSLPSGEFYSTEITSSGIMAFIVMKANAMEVRNKTKDAYDIWFCLAYHPGNVEAVAEAFRPQLGKNSVKVALTLMAKYFKTIHARGPKDVAEEEGTIDSDFRDFLRQDSFQRVQTLLKSLEFKSDTKQI